MLVDPEDPVEIAAAVERIVGSPAARAEWVDRGLKRAGEFTWARCAELTVHSYRRALGEGVSTRSL